MNRIRRGVSWPALGLLGAAALWGVVLPACKDGRRPVPAGPAGLPALPENRGAPDPAALVHAPSGAEAAAPAMPPDHPPVLQGAGEAAPRPGGTVSGKLVLGDKVKDKVAAGATVFLVARAYQEGGGQGAVLAVKKLEAARWPIPFELSGSDAMLEGSALAGKVILSVRVDQDGDAMTKMPGDVEGTSAPIAVPAKDVVLRLDTVRTVATGGGAMGGGTKPPGHP